MLLHVYTFPPSHLWFIFLNFKNIIIKVIYPPTFILFDFNTIHMTSTCFCELLSGHIFLGMHLLILKPSKKHFNEMFNPFLE